MEYQWTISDHQMKLSVLGTVTFNRIVDHQGIVGIPKELRLLARLLVVLH